jgi:hypothetical protein
MGKPSSFGLDVKYSQKELVLQHGGECIGLVVPSGMVLKQIQSGREVCLVLILKTQMFCFDFLTTEMELVYTAEIITRIAFSLLYTHIDACPKIFWELGEERWGDYVNALFLSLRVRVNLFFLRGRLSST